MRDVIWALANVIGIPVIIGSLAFVGTKIGDVIETYFDELERRRAR